MRSRRDGFDLQLVLALGALTIVLAAVIAWEAGVFPVPSRLVAPQAAAGSIIRLVEIANGLDAPVFLDAPSGDARLFVVEQNGRIRVIKNGVLLSTPYLDIHTKVSSGGERGLLSVAFDPRFATNGFFYVDYTDANGNTRVERYAALSPSADTASRASAKEILHIGHPYPNHNGGLVRFGPDGMLYIGTGDGGSEGDPDRYGQNPHTLLGKMLRIDVDGADPYRIPSDNPFARGGGSHEIWSSGLRNPWRYAFDSGMLYVADVGQNRWEEVDVVQANLPGLNYGWSVAEGDHCYRNPACRLAPFVRPVLEYAHSQGCAIIGGFVYRGKAIPALDGSYLYSDYCSGWIRALRYVNGRAVDQRELLPRGLAGVVSFGQDAAGELYVLTSSGNRVLEIVPR